MATFHYVVPIKKTKISDFEYSFINNDLEITALISGLNVSSYSLTMVCPFKGYSDYFELPVYVLAFTRIAFVINGKPSEKFYEHIQQAMISICTAGKYYYLHKSTLDTLCKCIFEERAKIKQRRTGYRNEFLKTKKLLKQQFKQKCICQREYQQQLKKARLKMEFSSIDPLIKKYPELGDDISISQIRKFKALEELTMQP